MKFSNKAKIGFFAVVFLVLTAQFNPIFKILQNNVYIGDGTNTDKVITLRTGLAGLASIRYNATLGKLQFSNDGVVFKNFGSGSGGGGGGINLLSNADLEDGIAVNWTSNGVTSVLDGGNQLIGTTSATFDPTAQDDYYRSDYVDVPKGLRGTACEARIYYNGGDGTNIKAVVENEDGETVGQYVSCVGSTCTNDSALPAHTLPGYESIFFLCPTEAAILADAEDGSLRLRLYQSTASNATAMQVDDFHLGSLIGLAETTLPDYFSAKISSTGVVTGENVDWINGNASISSTSLFALTFVSGTFSASPNCNVTSVQSAAGSASNKIEVQATTSGVSVRTYQASDAASVAYEFIIKCSKSTDAKQAVQVYKSVPKIAQNLNEFSATISSTGVVSGENTDWISGNCTISGGGSEAKTCTIIASLFSVVPSCTVSANAGGVTFANLSSLGTTSFQVNTATNAGGVAAAASIKCTRDLSELKMPTVQPIVVGQVFTGGSSSTRKVDVESLAVCSASPCTLDRNVGATSVTTSGTGLYQLNVPAGRCNTPLSCVVTSTQPQTIRDGTTPTATTYNFFTRNASNILTNAAFSVKCDCE